MNTIEEALIHSSSSGSITPLLNIVMPVVMIEKCENKREEHKKKKTIKLRK